MQRGLRRTAFFASASVGVIAAIACGERLVDDPIENEAGALDASTDLGVATDEAGRTCICLAPVPDGFTGPFVLDRLNACEEPWKNDEPVFAELDAGAHECACTCSATSSSCYLVPSTQSGACPATCGVIVAIPKTQSCVSKSGGCGSFYSIHADGGGPCLPTTSQRIDDAGFQRLAHECLPNDPLTTGVCPIAASPCAPQHGVTGEYCIERAGDSECPPAYSVKRTYHRGLSDTRSCSPCTCTSVGEPCAFVNHGDVLCDAGSVIGNGMLNLCSGYGSNIMAHRILRHERACAKNGAEPIGKAEATGQVTVCCRPEQ